jgi:hypothetical protein
MSGFRRNESLQCLRCYARPPQLCCAVTDKFSEGFGDCCDERFDGSGGDLSQQGFEFSEELFDGVEVWAVRGQVAQLGAGGLDGFADAGDFVAGEIVDLSASPAPP